jgi:hypothetical protein
VQTYSYQGSKAAQRKIKKTWIEENKMKIKKSVLQKIVKEEVSKLTPAQKRLLKKRLAESKSRKVLKEWETSRDLANIFIKASKSDLGDAVGEQFEETYENPDSFDDQNPNALKMIIDWLARHSRLLDEDLEDYLEQLKNYYNENY